MNKNPKRFLDTYATKTSDGEFEYLSFTQRNENNNYVQTRSK